MRIAAIIAVLLTASSATATTGVADELTNLCFDAGDNAVRWVVGDANSGYAAHELVIGGERRRLATFDDSGSFVRESELFSKRCATLRDALDLPMAAIEGAARATGDVRASFEGADGLVQPLTAAERPRCGYELSLAQAGQGVVGAAIEPCCGARELQVQGFPLPATTDLAVVVTFLGKCFESGYQTHTVAVARAVSTAPERIIRAGRSGRIPTDDNGRPRGELRIDLPPFAFDYGRLLGDAGFRAYQQGSYAVAIEYFDSAYERSRESIPDLEALFNLAATQSKVADTEAALMTLRRLLSFAGQRARFQKRVESDSDFDPMRDHPVFREVLVPASCCQWTEIEENNVDCWIDHCPEGGLRKKTETSYAFRRGERRILEQSVRVAGELRQLRHDDGDFVSKFASGEDRERGSYVGGLREGTWMLWNRAGARLSRVSYQRDKKHGIETTWYPSGSPRAERTWRAGELHGRTIDWFQSGGKRSQESYSAGERQGPVSKWFESGDKELAGRWEKGRTDGVWSTWSPEDGSVVKVEVHGAGVLRFRCEYTIFDGELRDSRRCNGTYFHDNGKPSASGLVLDGKPTGTWQRWSEAGTRQRKTAAPEDRPLSPERSTPPPEPR